MAIKLKNNNTEEIKKEKKERRRWLWYLVILSVLAAFLMQWNYPRLQQKAMDLYENPLESQEFIEQLYQSNYVLYKDLYEKVNKESISYQDLYFKITASDAEPEQFADELVSRGDVTSYEMDSQGEPFLMYEGKTYRGSEIKDFYMRIHVKEMHQPYQYDFEGIFNELSQLMDYTIIDNKTGEKVTNSSRDMSGSEGYHDYVKISYDEASLAETMAVRGEQPDLLFKRVSDRGRIEHLQPYKEELEKEFLVSISITGPSSCTVIYGITEENWQRLCNVMNDGDNAKLFYTDNPFTFLNYSWMENAFDYLQSHLKNLLWLFGTSLVLLAFFIPLGNKSPWNLKLFQIPLELLVFLAFCIFPLADEFAWSVSRMLLGRIPDNFLRQCGYFAYLSGLFGAIICVTYHVRQLREMGWKNYIKTYSLIYRFFPFISKKTKEFYHYLISFDVSTSTNKIIIRILVINGVVVLLCCSFWLFGAFGILIYSIILYFVLRKYVSDLKKNYEILLRATNQMAEGNLHVTIEEDLGLFEPFKPQITKIQEGFRNAVEEEVKSQRMKTELITNVSHDLKTPLTAIITYVDLLKDENLTVEQRREYVETLDKKSMRLKVLIEDLFEVSKANSKNVTLNLVEADLVNLLKQVQCELEEKLKASELSIRMNAPEEKVLLQLDSEKTYRVYENLLNNVAKYALPGTRVYLDVVNEEKSVTVVLKNISASELTVNPAELTERFVRGDASRNTEGSGLGLAIARSFVELQGGRMKLEIDGDLFKVTTTWYK